VAFIKPSFVRTIVLTLAAVMVVNLYGFGMLMAFGKPVTLVVDGEPTASMRVHGTVSDVVLQSGISLEPRDLISHGMFEPLTDDMVISVQHARQVDLTLNGQRGTYWTNAYDINGLIEDLGLEEASLKVSINRQAPLPREGAIVTIETGHMITVAADGKTEKLRGYGTVRATLEELGIIWNDDDIITPDPASLLADDLAISLVRVTYDTITREADIPFPITDTKDAKKPKGVVTVTTKGQKGLKNQTVDRTFHDGQLFTENVTSEEILKEPVTQVQTTGTKPPDVLAKVSPGSAQAIAYDMVKARGWNDNEFQCLVNLWQRESGWRTTAGNKSSGAYGIPQALPGSKMASAGADWQTNPATQIKWGLGYISGRYGTPCGAWNAFLSKGWY